MATETKKLERKAVPLELEDGELPLNTFSPKKPFKARPQSTATCRRQLQVVEPAHERAVCDKHSVPHR